MKLTDEADKINMANRLHNNVSDKCAEITNEIESFINSKFKELQDFILAHNDCFFDDENVCPCCGNKLLFGEEFVKSEILN